MNMVVQIMILCDKQYPLESKYTLCSTAIRADAFWRKSNENFSDSISDGQ